MNKHQMRAVINKLTSSKGPKKTISTGVNSDITEVEMLS